MSRTHATDALLAALSHELGNLLAAIRLSAHLIAAEDGKDGPRLAGEVERLAAWAGALLAHVRPLLGSSTGERFPVPAAELLEGLERVLEEGAANGAHLVLEAPAPDLPTACIDPEAVHRVLVALAMGALEASPAHGRVTASAGRAGEDLLLVLSDGGRPVDLEELERETPRSARELGLRLADAVLRLSGGGLRVEALPAGTRIEVRLAATSRAGGPS